MDLSNTRARYDTSAFKQGILAKEDCEPKDIQEQKFRNSYLICEVCEVCPDAK